MTCSKCECLVRVKNKLGYNLYYCGYKKYGVLKALSGLYINNEEYRKNSKTCKYYKGENKGRKEMTDEEKAEEQCKKDFCTCCLSFGKCERSIALCSKATNYCKSLLIEKLKKDNAELKAEIKQIIERERVVPEHYLIEMIDKNKELKTQIEKMKCCQNCKHSYTDSENLVFCYLPIPQEECKSCRIYNHKETENDYWELAEY